ncbi:phage tail tape measure protein [Microbacteriaceae bacterium VKM Ac-2854]|nr:phage tail tape measure protein [Microbacteriaceae bacterium VKM Ac-2854]
MGKTAILAIRIIGDAVEGVKALKDHAAAVDVWQKSTAVAGAVAGAALIAGFIGAADIESAQAKLTAQLGIPAEEAARYGEITGDLYAEGIGEGLDSLNTAIQGVVTNIPDMATASDDTVSKITEDVSNLATTFDQDLGATTTAVGQLMKTGMASDAQEALDIITVGLQSNQRAGDDLLDTFTEYPALFERLGLDGQTATGLINQGLDAGARNTDMVADALKEFQIRATDGSTASAAGFAALGMDAAAATAQIAAGGEGASAGLDQVLDGLRGMSDPVARNAAAVALFGTKAEDLGDALFALDPSTAVAGLGEVDGAATRLSETVEGGAQQALVAFQRTVETTFTDIAAQALPVITPILEGLREFAPILGPAAIALAAAAGAVTVISAAMKVYAAVQAIQTAAQWAQNAAWLANPITWIILAIIVAIGLIVAAIFWLIENWEEVSRVVADVWTGIVDWIAAAWTAIIAGIDAAVAWIVEVWNGFWAFLAAGWDAVVSFIVAIVDSVVAWITGAVNLIVAVWNLYWAIVAAIWQAIFDFIGSVIDSIVTWITGAVANIVTGWNLVMAVANAVWNAVLAVVRSVIDGIVAAVQTVIDTVTNTFTTIQDIVGGVFDFIRDASAGVWDVFIDGIKGAIGWIQDAIGFLGDLFSGQASAASAQADLSSGPASRMVAEADVAPVAMSRMMSFTTEEAATGFAATTTALTTATSDPYAAQFAGLNRFGDRPEKGDTYNITVNGAIDPDGTARTIRKVLTDSARKTGTLTAAGSSWRS